MRLGGLVRWSGASVFSPAFGANGVAAEVV